MWIVIIIITLLLMILAFFAPSSEEIPDKKQVFEDEFGDPNTIIGSNDGLMVGKGRISKNLSHRHLAIIGGTGSGKTSRQILNNILLLKNESAIILDPCRDILPVCGGYLQKQGYRIVIFDPADASRSCGFNPLETAKTITDLNIISEQIFASQSRNTKDQFWVDTAKQLTTLFLRLQQKFLIQHNNLGNTARLLNVFQSDTSTISALFARYSDQNLWEAYTPFAKMEPRLKSNVGATTMAGFTLFQNDEVAKLTSCNTFSFEELREDRVVLVLQPNLMDLNLYGCLIEIFFTRLFRYLMEKPASDQDRDLMFFLDELGNFKIKGFPEALSLLRKAHCSISFSLQSRAQLSQKFSVSESQTILANCSKLVFPNCEPDLAKEISERMGKHSFQRDDKTRSERSLMSPSEIIHLPENKAIFLCGNERPMVITTQPYFDNFWLNRKASLPYTEIGGGITNDIEYIDLTPFKQK